MADTKLRCALVYRLEAGNTVTLAKYDHAGQYESHGGASTDESALYGGRDKAFAEAVAKVIENDPPGGLAEAGSIGGFKVVQSDQHQVVYGADSEGICKYCTTKLVLGSMPGFLYRAAFLTRYISLPSLVFIGFGVITGLGYPSRVAIQMLQEIYTEFMAKFSAEAKTGDDNALTRKGKNILTDACKKYDDLNKVDKSKAVLGQVEQVKSTMQGNIADMLKNTEQADSLAEKSDQLNEQASVFKKKSGDLRKQMACKNLKMTLLLGGIVVVVLIVILAPLISRM